MSSKEVIPTRLIASLIHLFSIVKPGLVAGFYAAIIFKLLDVICPLWLKQFIVSIMLILNVMNANSIALQKINAVTVVRIIYVLCILCMHWKRNSIFIKGALPLANGVGLVQLKLLEPLILMLRSDGLDLGFMNTMTTPNLPVIFSFIIISLVIHSPLGLFLTPFHLFFNHYLKLSAMFCSLIGLWKLLLTLDLASFFLRKFVGFFIFLFGTFPAYVMNQILSSYRNLESKSIEKKRDQRKNLSPYRYHQLSSSRTIRLLKLRKRKFLSDIDCELLDVNLDTAPDFIAISYTWGKDQEKYLIEVNGRQLDVSGKVYNIIQHQGSFFEDRLLWIDSICINQQDTFEKTAQVQLMRDIFTRATDVVGWLGGGEEGLSFLFKIANLITKKQMYLNEPSKIWENEYLRSDDDIDGWRPLTRFFQDPWFTRVWVVQEVALAPKLRVVFGRTVIQWEIIEELFSVLALPAINTRLVMVEEWDGIYHSLSRQPLSGVLNGGVMNVLRKSTNGGVPISLHNILDMCAAFQSTDPRDKIYALLGLSADYTRGEIIPDYTIPVEKVYINSTKVLLSPSTDGTLLLKYAGIGEARTHTDLPSWVPDWQDRNAEEYPHRKKFDMYNVATNRPAEIKWNNDSDQLLVRGLFVDKLVSCGPVLDRGILHQNGRHTSLVQSNNATFMGIREWLINTVSYLRGSFADQDPAMTDEMFFGSFQRALVGNCVENQYPVAPDSLSGGFEVFSWFYGFKQPDQQPGFDQIMNTNPGASQEQIEQITTIGAVLSYFNNDFGATCLGTKMGFTESGLIAVVPPLSEPGDVIAHIAGTRSPYLLRKASNPQEIPTEKQSYRLVGSCFVTDAMESLDDATWNNEALLITLE